MSKKTPVETRKPRPLKSASSLMTETPSDSKESKRGGRKPGSVMHVVKEARAKASEVGLLPHEWLLKISRGEAIPHKQWSIKYDKQGNEVSRELIELDVYADFLTRIDCAKACAGFYAPKLTAQKITLNDSLNLTELSDDAIDAKLEELIADGNQAAMIIKKDRDKAKGKDGSSTNSKP